MLGSLFRIGGVRGTEGRQRLLLSWTPVRCSPVPSWLSLSVEPTRGDSPVSRLLLQLVQSQQASFALERNLRTQQEIEDQVRGFSFREDTLLWMAAVSISSRICVN